MPYLKKDITIKILVVALQLCSLQNLTANAISKDIEARPSFPREYNGRDRLSLAVLLGEDQIYVK